MRKITVALIVIALAVFGILQYDWTDPLQHAADATFALYVKDDVSPARFECTATAFQRVDGGYYLLTAGHCIEQAPDAQYSVSEQIGMPREEVRVVKYFRDDLLDFAVIQFLTPKKYPVIPLGRDQVVGVQIMNPNFSFGLVKQVSIGMFSSVQMSHVQDCESCEGKSLVQIFGGPGASGSAVIANGKIVAVVTALLEDMNVGLVVTPISRYPAFLAAPLMEKPQKQELTRDTRHVIVF
jgi:hypothetical protein